MTSVAALLVIAATAGVLAWGNSSQLFTSTSTVAGPPLFPHAAITPTSRQGRNATTNLLEMPIISLVTDFGIPTNLISHDISQRRLVINSNSWSLCKLQPTFRANSIDVDADLLILSPLTQAGLVWGIHRLDVRRDEDEITGIALLLHGNPGLYRITIEEFQSKNLGRGGAMIDKMRLLLSANLTQEETKRVTLRASLRDGQPLQIILNNHSLDLVQMRSPTNGWDRYASGELGAMALGQCQFVLVECDERRGDR